MGGGEGRGRWGNQRGVVMVDRLFSEPSLAELYDAFCAGRKGFGFLPSAGDVGKKRT